MLGFSPSLHPLAIAQQGVDFEYFTGIGHRSKMEDTVAGRLAALSLKGSHPASIAWAEARKAFCKPIAPHVAGLLHSLILDGSACNESFADWCSNFGYDTDSRKAFATYEACQQGIDKLRRILSNEQIKAIEKALQDY